MSTIVYATTSCRNQPMIPPTPLVMTIARGEAMLALEHSSLKWNGASYPLYRIRINQCVGDDRDTNLPHCPDDGDKGHQQCNAIGVVSPLVEIPPDNARWGKFGETLVFSVGRCGNHDDNDDQGDDVERRPIRIERRNPFSRHAADA